MGQVNIGKGNHTTPSDGTRAYGFLEDGTPVYIDENGNKVPLSTSSILNIVSTKGIGLESNLPGIGLANGDTYVSNDTFKYFIYDGASWSSVALTDSQFITDISIVTELPPLYQYFNNIIMPIANYVTNELEDLPE